MRILGATGTAAAFPASLMGSAAASYQAGATQAPVAPGMQRQMEIYTAGLLGQLPGQPVASEALEARARELMTPQAYGYVAGGAGAEDTLRANLEAFRGWRIVPRMLRDVSRRRLEVELFDRRLPAPVLLAPIGVQSIIHRDAEVAAARAAAGLGLPLILSTAASSTLEDVAAAMGEAPRWFQLYWPRDRELAARRACRSC